MSGDRRPGLEPARTGRGTLPGAVGDRRLTSDLRVTRYPAAVPVGGHALLQRAADHRDGGRAGARLAVRAARCSSSTTGRPTAPASCCRSSSTTRGSGCSSSRGNQGKGAALRRGFAEATRRLRHRAGRRPRVRPRRVRRAARAAARGDKADVVFGSRFLGEPPHRVLYFWHSVGNRLLTLPSNMFTNLNLTDMETCYKVFRREVAPVASTLEEDRFGIEPEITAKVARRRLADLRGRHLLRRAHLRRGQEDRLARRRAGHLLHRPLLARR